MATVYFIFAFFLFFVLLPFHSFLGSISAYQRGKSLRASEGCVGPLQYYLFLALIFSSANEVEEYIVPKVPVLTF